MMSHLTNDPSFWLAFWALVGMVFTAAATLLGLVIAWAKAKTAEYEARDAKGTAQTVQAGQGAQQVTLGQHTAAIAALQASSQGAGGGGQPQASGAPIAPVAPATAPVAPIAGPVSPTPSSESTAPGGGLIVPDGG